MSKDKETHLMPSFDHCYASHFVDLVAISILESGTLRSAMHASTSSQFYRSGEPGGSVSGGTGGLSPLTLPATSRFVSRMSSSSASSSSISVGGG